ncbi:hypothetical protein [Burkholderia cenocepacia]|uniref:hypothetical protein n=1 Tax=Burkholderia cenocepacia TaxID=95486 RepID=UPI002B241F42|nr:hypothetical protein [Burkholderia cenocepacia]MEB2543770.1 hypothetical protein [Burkholderia cenocepacia]
MVFLDVQLARGLDHKGASHRTTLLTATVERLPGSLRLQQSVERTGRAHKYHGSVSEGSVTQRLQDIGGRLYRPAGGVRQVFALSRADAERRPRLSSIAIISITSPDRSPAKLDGFDHLLRLSFADVNFLSPLLSTKAQNKLVDAFTTEQAQTIRTFVESLPDEIVSIVVHCEGGYSRSFSIALALHLLYDYDADLEHLVQTNPSVVRVMVGDNHARLVMLRGVEKGIGDALAGRVQTEGEFRKSLRRLRLRKR